jgi:hypothetical protein
VIYHKGNLPSEGCQDSGDPDLPVPSMREWGHRPERTESIREPAISLQGLWGLRGLGAQGAVYGSTERADSAGLSGAGLPAGTAEAVWGLHRDGPPPGSRDLAAGRGRGRPGSFVGRKDPKISAGRGLRRKPPVGGLGRPSRKPIGLRGGRCFRLPPADPPLRGQEIGPAGSYRARA